MSAKLQDFLAACRARSELALSDICRRQATAQRGAAANLTGALQEAIAYSLLGDGKRLRAALVYAGGGAVCDDVPAAALDQIAASIECLHCYSLIHDDLPAMDDDDLRRGRPSCHRAFGEATAILAGDALQCLAFELLADCPDTTPELRLALIKNLAAAAGAGGMVGGQHIDLNIDPHHTRLADLTAMHTLKTGALISSAIAMGGLAGNASPSQLQMLDSYGQTLGLAFQVKDDLLDIEGCTATLGKQQGSDLANDKVTFPSLLGLEASREHLESLRQQAAASVEPLGERGEILAQLADYIVARQH